MYVLVHSVYTLYGWSMVEDWHEQVKDKHPRFTDHPQIQQTQSTLSKFGHIPWAQFNSAND